MCPSMDAYLMLYCLEADLERICFRECYLLGILLRKPGRMLGSQDQRGSRPSKGVSDIKPSVRGAAGSGLQRALETKQAMPWRFLSEQGSWYDRTHPSSGHWLTVASGKTWIPRHFYLCYGTWVGRIFVWVFEDTRYCCLRPHRVSGFCLHNEWVNSFHFVS